MTELDTTIIPQKYVYVSATQPTDTTKGKLWYNTTDNQLYTANGTTYNIMTTNLTPVNKDIQQNALNILVNSAGASTTLNDWNNMIVDRFIDANGQLNTVDTTNTTAYFYPNKYENQQSNTYNITLPSGDSETTTLTNNFTVKSDIHNCYISSFPVWNRDNYNTYTVTVTIKKNTTVLATKSVSLPTKTSTVITFVQTDYSELFNEGDTITVITSGANGHVGISASGTLDTIAISATSQKLPPKVGNFTIDYTTIQNEMLQTNPQTIDAGLKAVQIYSHNETAGTGNITGSISLDGGTTWTDNIPLNTKTAITSSDGTNLIMKLNLNGEGDGNIANIYDYALMLFY